jgi:hypothetical protein
MWIKSTWPLAKEVTQSVTSDPLEQERMAVQEVFRESVNRIQGRLAALCSQDNEAVAGCLFDALLVLTDHMADTEARMGAAYTGNDALLRRRAAIQHGAAGSSVRDVMFSLAKKEFTVQNFFRLAGSGGQ